MWQTDVEKFLGVRDFFFFFFLLLHYTSMCLGIKLTCRGSAVRNTDRILTQQDLRGKSPYGTYNLGHSGSVTRDMALCDTSQAAALNSSVSWSL